MIRSTILLAFVALMFACQPQKQKDTSKITIAGKLTNSATEKVFILEGRKKTEIQLADSIFTTKLPATGQGIIKTITIGDSRISLFLMPGDSVFINFDAKTKDYSFSADQAIANEYLKAKASNNKAHFFDPWSKFDLELADFTATMDSLSEANIAFLDKYITKNPKISKDFTYFEKGDINYQVYLYKSYYASNYSYISKDTIDLESAYFDFKKSINMNDAKLLNSGSYQQYTGYAISTEAGKLSDKDSSIQKTPNPISVSRLEVIKNKITDKELLDYHLYSLLKTQFDYYGTKGVENVLPYFKEHCTVQNYQSEIDSLKIEWEKIGKGKDSYNFTAVDLSGKEFTQDDFKGKYIFIDCWATWCGPCLGEVPYLEKIIDEYKDKSIAFVSLSFDQRKADWEKFLKAKETKGYQLYLDNDERQKLADFYKVTGIPRFILINTEGKIYDVQAPRPSSNLTDVLNGLEDI